MAFIALIAATGTFLLGLGVGLVFMLPFSKFNVNTFTRGILVSLMAGAPMVVGAVAVGAIASLTGSDRHPLAFAYFVGIMAGAIWDRLKETRRRR